MEQTFRSAERHELAGWKACPTCGAHVCGGRGGCETSDDLELLKLRAEGDYSAICGVCYCEAGVDEEFAGAGQRCN